MSDRAYCSIIAAELLYKAALAVENPSPELQAAIAACNEDIAARRASADEIEAARDEWASDDIEIDDVPLVSPAEDGVWVNAWLWVQKG